jgi:hypothetical protein
MYLLLLLLKSGITQTSQSLWQYIVLLQIIIDLIVIYIASVLVDIRVEAK